MEELTSTIEERKMSHTWHRAIRMFKAFFNAFGHGSNAGNHFHGMDKPFLILLLVLMVSFNFRNPERIEVRIPTVDEETHYVWTIIQDIEFYDQYGYDISLPSGDVIDDLIDKSREGNLTPEEYSLLEAFMQKDVYSESDYQKGYEKIQNALPLVNRMIDYIGQGSRNWNFNIFEKYKVTLTLYGPGGSYNPDEGSILFYTTPKGKFKQYDNPSNILIHEITHLGIEESIIMKFNVPHGLKERIVDTFVYLNFHELLPEYRIQPMGDNRIDAKLHTSRDLENLADIVKRFMQKNE